jgi:hypothetical protein
VEHLLLKKKNARVLLNVCFVPKRKNDNAIFVGYGYGFLAVFIISALSLGGLLSFPLIYKASFQYVLVTFTALAVGTLFGDAMFHLIPFVCIDFLLILFKMFRNNMYKGFTGYRRSVFIVMNQKDMNMDK